MFIQNLNKEQQSALLFLANELIKADGTLEDAEINIMETLTKQCELGITPASVKIDQLSTIFNSNKAKYSALLELIAIAHADNQYHKEEQELISQYTASLNISNEILMTLESWVKKQLSLSQEINTLLNQ